jgi:hypothetical protein
MPDLVPGEQSAQVAALDIAPAVVGHQSLRADAVLGVEGECALEEADDGRARWSSWISA